MSGRSLKRTIGVLALQGAFARHAGVLRDLGAGVRLVRVPQELSGLDGLIIPGGESTVMSRLLDKSGLRRAVKDQCAAGLPVFGTCAGLILLSAETTCGSIDTLGLLDAVVERNGYGRQRDSFRAGLKLPAGTLIEGIFIRAPRIVSAGPEVEIIAEHRGDPVLVRQGRVLAASFHPELTDGDALHRYFIEQFC